MYKFNKLMIALDLSSMDKAILKYAGKMCDIIEPQKVYFINIQPNLDLDDEAKSLLMGDDKMPMDEYVMDTLKEEVAENFSSSASFETEYEVVEGNPSNELLRWVKMKDADLTIMGRKKDLSNGGSTPQQVASKVLSSVLIVPEEVSEFGLDHIFVPVDFSEDSKRALEEAFEIKEDAGSPIKITTTNVYELPLGYEKSGKTADQFGEILERNAIKKFHKFKEQFGKNAESIKASFKKVKEGSSIAETINNEAHQAGANLIVMGAKGRTLATQLFLGSVCHKLIRHDSDIPLLIVKDKEHTFDFWDYFKSI